MREISDYIKREDAVRRVAVLIAAEAESDGYEVQPMENYIEYASEDLADIPSADVAPVRHGMWKMGCGGNGWNDWYVFECPLCGIKIEDRNGRGMDWEYNYCPNCGAKMDEGETNE